MVTLRAKHQRFVDEYVRCGIASAAYQRAGYRARGHAAEVNASRLRRRPDVAAAVEAALEADAPSSQARQPVRPRWVLERATLGHRVWSLHKDGQQMDCELFDHGEDGVEAVLSCRESQWSAGRRLDDWAQALTHANLTRGDFERHGWRDTTP